MSSGNGTHSSQQTSAHRQRAWTFAVRQLGRSLSVGRALRLEPVARLDAPLCLGVEHVDAASVARIVRHFPPSQEGCREASRQLARLAQARALLSLHVEGERHWRPAHVNAIVGLACRQLGSLRELSLTNLGQHTLITAPALWSGGAPCPLLASLKLDCRLLPLFAAAGWRFPAVCSLHVTQSGLCSHRCGIVPLVPVAGLVRRSQELRQLLDGGRAVADFRSDCPHVWPWLRTEDARETGAQGGADYPQAAHVEVASSTHTNRTRLLARTLQAVHTPHLSGVSLLTIRIHVANDFTGPWTVSPRAVERIAELLTRHEGLTVRLLVEALQEEVPEEDSGLNMCPGLLDLASQHGPSGRFQLVTDHLRLLWYPAVGPLFSWGDVASSVTRVFDPEQQKRLQFAYPPTLTMKLRVPAGEVEALQPDPVFANMARLELLLNLGDLQGPDARVTFTQCMELCRGGFRDLRKLSVSFVDGEDKAMTLHLAVEDETRAKGTAVFDIAARGDWAAASQASLALWCEDAVPSKLSALVAALPSAFGPRGVRVLTAPWLSLGVMRVLGGLGHLPAVERVDASEDVEEVTAETKREINGAWEELVHALPALVHLRVPKWARRHADAAALLTWLGGGRMVCVQGGNCKLGAPRLLASRIVWALFCLLVVFVWSLLARGDASSFPPP